MNYFALSDHLIYGCQENIYFKQCFNPLDHTSLGQSKNDLYTLFKNHFNTLEIALLKQSSTGREHD